MRGIGLLRGYGGSLARAWVMIVSGVHNMKTGRFANAMRGALKRDLSRALAWMADAASSSAVIPYRSACADMDVARVD